MTDTSEPAPIVGRVHRILARPVVWWGLAVVATLIHVGARIIRTRWYFFWDDTQLGAYGQWYELGSRLLSGRWTLLDPGAWQGGNLTAEGQWGIWSPLSWALALGSHVVPNAAVYSTIVKIFFLLVLCTGVFVLARSLGASPAWAAVGAFAATAGGQTMYLDAPSWVTGLENVGLFALAWWALRRAVHDKRSPIPFFVFSYLLVTVGYVFGVIELVFLFVFTLMEVWIRFGPKAMLRPLGLGLFAGFLTVFVYLPGLLTSPVTVRSGNGIENDLFLNMDLSDLATSPISTAISTIRGYWGDAAPVPLQYISWLVPLLVIVAIGFVRHWRELFTVYGVLLSTVAMVIGPSVLGPLRYPARMLPYVVLCLALLISVLATKAWPKSISAPQRIGVLVATAASAWLAWAAQPTSWAWVGVAFLVQVACLVAVDHTFRRGRRGGGSGWAVPAVALVASLVALAPQIARYPSSPLGDFRVPSSVQALEDVGNDLENGIMTVGDVYSLQRNPDAYAETLLANLWYVTGRDAVGVYTVLPFKTFADDLCIDIRGWTCPEAYETLFDTSMDQPVSLADDLRLNTVIVIKGTGLESEPAVAEGWSVRAGDYTWTLERDEPVEPAGAVARTSRGTDVSVTELSETSVTIRVDEVSTEGGDVVFSRLAWPGYTTTGGNLVDAERGYLLTLGLEPEDEGKEITLTFRPPGWALEVGAAIAAGLLAVSFSVVHLVQRHRNRETLEASAFQNGNIPAS